MIVSASGLILSVVDASFCSRPEQNLSRLPQSAHFLCWSVLALLLVVVGDAGLRLKCARFGGDVMSLSGPSLHGTSWGIVVSLSFFRRSRTFTVLQSSV